MITCTEQPVINIFVHIKKFCFAMFFIACFRFAAAAAVVAAAADVVVVVVAIKDRVLCCAPCTASAAHIRAIAIMRKYHKYFAVLFIYGN